jgi:hypothetical protein
MGDHEGAIGDKQAEKEKKQRIRQPEPKSSFDNSHAWDSGSFLLAGAPFVPRMEEHAETFSRIPFPAQRREFIMRLHQTYGNRYLQQLAESMNVQPRPINAIQRNGPNGGGEGEEEPQELEVIEDEEIEQGKDEANKKGKDADDRADEAIRRSEEGGEAEKGAGVLGRLWKKHWHEGPTEKRAASFIEWIKLLVEGVTQILEWAKVFEMPTALGAVVGFGSVIKRGAVFVEKGRIFLVYSQSTKEGKKVEKRIKPSGTLGFRTKEKTAGEYARDKVLRAATWGLVRFIETIINFFIGIFGEATAKLAGGIIKAVMLAWQYGGRAIKAIVKEFKGKKGVNRREASEGIFEEAKEKGPGSNAWELVENIMKLKYPVGNRRLEYDGDELVFRSTIEGEMVGLEIVDCDEEEIKQTLYDSMSSKAEISIGLPGKQTVGEIIG